MTGRAVTDLDDVFSLCLKGEVDIKAGYAICLCFGNANLLGDIGEKLRGKVAVLLLNVLNDRD